nr:hypothetical protein [Burkholderia vietnamiensis]
MLGRYDDALASYAAAAAEPGSTAQELCTRAVARQQLGDYAGALADFAPACRHDPNHGIARRSDAFCRLLTGDFATGWRLHEARWDAADVTFTGVMRAARSGPPTHRSPAARCCCTRSRASATRCSSAATPNGRLIIGQCRSNAGAGCPAATTRLTPRSVPSSSASVAGAWSTTVAPRSCARLSFRTTLDTVPADVPYLHADPRRRAAWRARPRRRGACASGSRGRAIRITRTTRTGR